MRKYLPFVANHKVTLVVGRAMITAWESGQSKLAISFKQLAENHPEAELEIVAMEKRGQDKFLLRSKTAPTADKSELSAEYFTIYNHYQRIQA